MMLRKVVKYGVQYRDVFYIDHRLMRWMWRRLEIEPLPTSPPVVRVLDRRGNEICLAVRHADLTGEEIYRIIRERSLLRAHDRRWLRRLYTGIETDARERTAAVAPRVEEIGNHSLVEALFTRLPVNRPVPVAPRGGNGFPSPTTPEAEHAPESRIPPARTPSGQALLNRPIATGTDTGTSSAMDRRHA